jgi:hypothetical protein
LSSGFTKRPRSGKYDASSRHAKGMAKRDCTTIGIDVFSVVRQPELTRAGKDLRCESFAKIDEVDILERQFPALAQALDSRDRSNAHDARLDADCCRSL